MCNVYMPIMKIQLISTEVDFLGTTEQTVSKNGISGKYRVPKKRGTLRFFLNSSKEFFHFHESNPIGSFSMREIDCVHCWTLKMLS